MARRSKSGEYSYSRTAQVRGREADGRFAVIQLDGKHTRVVKRRCNGTAPGPGELVPSDQVFDIKLTRVVPTGQRRTVTLPLDVCNEIGIKEDTPLEITLESDGRLSIVPLRAEGTSDQLDELLLKVTNENLHGEVSTGDAVGGEAW